MHAPAGSCGSYRSSFGEPHRGVGRLPFWVINSDLTIKVPVPSKNKVCKLPFSLGVVSDDLALPMCQPRGS